MPSDLTPAQRAAVRAAVQRTGRYATVTIDRDDREQEAALAVLLVSARDGCHPDEAAAYLARRATGHVVDAIREDARTGRGWSRTLRVMHPHDDIADAVDLLIAPDDPESHARARQAAAIVDRLPHPLPYVARRLAEGVQNFRIAQDLGVTPARISQHTRTLREKVALACEA